MRPDEQLIDQFDHLALPWLKPDVKHLPGHRLEDPARRLQVRSRP